MKSDLKARRSGQTSQPDQTKPAETAAPCESKRQLEKFGRLLRKRENAYLKKHNQLADSIEIRNKAQGRLTQNAVEQGTQNEAVQQVGLSQASKLVDDASLPGGLQRMGLPTASQVVGETKLAKGFVDGFSAGKAEAKGMTPEQYAHPTGKAHLQAGGKVLQLAPDAIQTATGQQRVLKNSVAFQGAEHKLQAARMTDLVAQHGTLKKQKHGRLQSASYQANSPEELAAMLAKTRPNSNIRQSDIDLPIPGSHGLLPPEAPQRLPKEAAPKQSSPFRREPQLSPQQKAEQELVKRDQRIGELDAQLRQQDPIALQQSLRKRDYYQTRTGIDALKGLANTPVESATLGINYLYQKIPKGQGAIPLFNGDTIHRAEEQVGHSVGREIASGNAEKMLQAQTRVEALHGQGKPIARELKGLHEQKAMETDRQMTIDRDGDKFYDAFETPRQIGLASKQYHDTALKQLPRHEDRLYLNNEIVPPVPGSVSEFIRRPLGTEPRLPEPVIPTDIKIPGSFPTE